MVTGNTRPINIEEEMKGSAPCRMCVTALSRYRGVSSMP